MLSCRGNTIFIMRILNYVIAVTLVIFCPAIYSCVEDEENVKEKDYTLPASGSITVEDENGNQSYVRHVYNAGYCLWSTDYNEPATLSLMATFKNEGSAYDESFLSNDMKISRISLDVYDMKSLIIGKIADSGDMEVNCFRSDGRGYYDWSDSKGYFYGDVSITSIDPNRYITVKFSNCKFSMYNSSASVNPRTFKGSYFNGEIKFPLRKRDFFY